VDLNGDGILDVITGEYSPGNILFFAGARGALRKKLVVPERIDKTNDDFTMATSYPVDWDGDGDFDLVVGSVKGKVFVNLNEGTCTEFRFGERVPVLAVGKPLKVIQKSDPIPVDWDGDGILDLLVGDEATGVTFFKGARDRTFAPGISVFTGEPIPGQLAFEELLAWWQNQSKIPGYRARLAVSDWNEDGKPDLLIGNCEEVENKTTGNVYVLLRQ